MTPAEVQRVRQQFLVVGAGVEHHRQGARRVDTADRAVQRELADRDPHAADAEVTETQYALAVGHHDHVDLLLVDGGLEQLVNSIAQRPGKVQPVFASIRPGPLLAGQPDGRGVHDRQQALEPLTEEGVEQHCVALLQSTQEYMPTHVGLLLVIFPSDPRQLSVEVLDRRRQQSVEPEPGPLVSAEGGALVAIAVGE